MRLKTFLPQGCRSSNHCTKKRNHCFNFFWYKKKKNAVPDSIYQMKCTQLILIERKEEKEARRGKHQQEKCGRMSSIISGYFPKFHPGFSRENQEQVLSNNIYACHLPLQPGPTKLRYKLNFRYHILVSLICFLELQFQFHLIGF